MSRDGETGLGHDDLRDDHDLQTFKICEFFAHVNAVTCAHIGRRSCQLLATGSADRVVKLWKIGNPRAQMTLNTHSDTVRCLKFTADEGTLLSGCRDGSIRIFDLNHNGAQKGKIINQHQEITAIDPHPYCGMFATGTIDGKLEIWSSEQRQRIASYPVNSSAVSALKLSPDGHYVCVGHSSGAVKVWDLKAGKLLTELLADHRGQVNAAAFNPVETTFSIGSEHGYVEVFELWDQGINPLATTEMHAPVSQMIFNSSGDTLLCASNEYLGVISVDQPQIEHLAFRDDLSLANLVDLCYDVKDSCILAASFDNTAVTIHSILASEHLNFGTSSYRPAVKEPFMAPKRNIERQPPACSDIQPSHGSETPIRPAAKATKEIVTEHAIDDYVDVENVVPSLLADHDSSMEILNERLTKAKQLSILWAHGRVKEALQELILMKDFVVTANFLAATQRPFNDGVLTLQLCPTLLLVVDMVLNSKHENHLKAALDCLMMVLLCYSEVIISTRKGPMLTSCDVARDERLARCNECYNILVDTILEKVELIAETSNDLNGISTNLITQIRNLA